MEGYSDRIVIPDIPEGPGVCLIESETGELLQIAASNNIRRRIGELLDSQGTICVHGPKIYAAQRDGDRIYIRWKLTPQYTVHNPGHADHEFRCMPITDSVSCRSVIPVMPIKKPGEKWWEMAG